MVKAILAVRTHSKAKTPARKAVLFALASYADDDGSNAFPSWTTLMRDTGASRDTVAAALQEAVKNGEIQCTGERPRRTRVYTFAPLLVRSPDQSARTTSLSSRPLRSDEPTPLVRSADSTGLLSRPDQAVPSNDQSIDQNSLSQNGSLETPEQRRAAKERESLESELLLLTAQLKSKPCERTARAAEQIRGELNGSGERVA